MQAVDFFCFVFRTRDNWIEMLKHNILRHVGRVNITMPKKEDISKLNLTGLIKNFENSSVFDDGNFAEKMRSFYPSCEYYCYYYYYYFEKCFSFVSGEIPKNVGQDVWKDENSMHLYFNISAAEEKGVNIASAILRLYRLPEKNATNPKRFELNCDGNSDEKLMRVSIYWYQHTKSTRKNRSTLLGVVVCL